MLQDRLQRFRTIELSLPIIGPGNRGQNRFKLPLRLQECIFGHDQMPVQDISHKFGIQQILECAERVHVVELTLKLLNLLCQILSSDENNSCYLLNLYNMGLWVYQTTYISRIRIQQLQCYSGCTVYRYITPTWLKRRRLFKDMWHFSPRLRLGLIHRSGVKDLEDLNSNT